MCSSSPKIVLSCSKQAVYASVHWLQYTLILFLSTQKQEGKQQQMQDKSREAGEMTKKALVQECIPDCDPKYFDAVSKNKTK